MAYIRTIKSTFFTSMNICLLTALARLLYIALWTEADREGRFTWRPGNFKLRFLPGDDCDIHALCKELVDSGLVIPYTVNGEVYAEIPTFKRHQSINNKERKSVLPARPATATTGCNDTSGTRDDAWSACSQERKGTGEEATPPSQAGDASMSTTVYTTKKLHGMNLASHKSTMQEAYDDF